jgi:hypothetical protein
MNKLNNILTENGKEGVELYRQSLIDNDRVATGETKENKGLYSIYYYPKKG